MISCLLYLSEDVLEFAALAVFGGAVAVIAIAAGA
jgi:hypothetical protein